MILIAAGSIALGGSSIPLLMPEAGHAISSAFLGLLSPATGSLQGEQQNANSPGVAHSAQTSNTIPLTPNPVREPPSNKSLDVSKEKQVPSIQSNVTEKPDQGSNASTPSLTVPNGQPASGQSNTSSTSSAQQEPGVGNSQTSDTNAGSGAGGGGSGGGGSSFVPPNSPPTIVVPSDMIMEAVNSSGAKVSYVVTAHDYAGKTLLPKCDPESGAIFPIAVTSVSCSVTDSLGTSATSVFHVTVRVTLPPRISAPPGITVASTGNFTKVVLGNPTVTDAVDPSPTVLNNAPAEGFPVGNTTVIWNATDHYGNSATAAQLVKVTESTPDVPIITVPANMTVPAVNASGVVVKYTGVSAHDAKDGNLSPACVPPAGAIFPIGFSLVSCSATNSAGNTTHASFSIQVKVTIPPSILAPGDVVANSTGQSTVVNLGSPVVTDPFDNSPTVSNNASNTGFPVGISVVMWTAKDHYGNSATAIQHVTINPDAGPQTMLSIGTGSYTTSQHTYVSSSTSLALSGQGPIGIAGTYFRYYASGASPPAFSKGTSFFLSGQDGPYSVQYYSQDTIGVNEGIRTASVILDNSPPQTFSSAVNGTIIAAGNSLNFTISDGSGSGVGGSTSSGIYYAVDGASPPLFSRHASLAVSLDHMTGGSHTITFYAVDNLGNRENTRLVKFAIYDCSTLPLTQVKGVVFGDRTLVDEQGGYPALPATPPLSTRMADISSKGFNTLRVVYFWDAYMKHQSSTLSEMGLVASTAANYNLCVFFDFQQWNTATKYGGSGFPLNFTSNYSTQGDFWTAYFNNTISLNGEQVWQMQSDMMGNIVGAVDKYPSVMGYEILNEPYMYSPDQYAKLGNLQTFIAANMRQHTTKAIFFDKAEPQYSSVLRVHYVDMTYDPLTKPRVSNTVFAPHEYNSIYAPGLPPQDLTGYQNLDAAMGGMPLVIGEWGQTTQAGTSIFVSTFKAQNVGWIRYCYDPFDSTYNLMSSTYHPTTNMQWLLAAMAAYP